ncbi:MAG: hypothetical protein KatS3mg068_0733 [Candidatus Sericytochromatia bacterium]|nr:MAG: hypothetical protein KatS3mg068_0733 [Candidatus Sericytochromatia bacterium]
MENFIELNENTIFYFDNWIYDAIINKLIKYMEDKEDFKFYDIVFNAKRENNSFLSLKDLNISEFHYFFNLLRSAINKKEKSFFVKEKKKEFFNKFDELLEAFYKDDRFYQKY